MVSDRVRVVGAVGDEDGAVCEVADQIKAGRCVAGLSGCQNEARARTGVLLRYERIDRSWRLRATSKRKPIIGLPSPLLVHLRGCVKAAEQRDHPMTHVVEWNGEPDARIDQAFRRVVKDAGLGPDVTPHILRHTAVTWALQGGAETWDVAGFFGLTAATISRVYGHHSPSHQESVHAAIARRGRSGRATP